MVLTKITSYYEKSLRLMSSENSRMKYLNVSLSGLRGCHHPALSGIYTTKEVQKSRIHLKMMAGDFLTYEIKSKQSGGGPHCRCCQAPSPPPEDLPHILTSCDAYSDIRTRFITQYEILCTQAKSDIILSKICDNSEVFCQFVLDPGSFNLKNRIHTDDPTLDQFFKLSRDYCYAVNAARKKILRGLQ